MVHAGLQVYIQAHAIYKLRLSSIRLLHNTFTAECDITTELSTGRIDPRVGSGRIGSGQIGSGHDFAGFWRVVSGQHFGFMSFFTEYFLVPESI